MPFISVQQGGPDIPDGVYPMVLVEISDPRTVQAQRGPKAGQEIDLIDWTFAIDQPGSPADQQTIEMSTSTASGPRSKMYGLLTALLGGRTPDIGQNFEKTDLAGRYLLGTVQRDPQGWPRIMSVSAMPAQMLQQTFARQTGTPVQQSAPAQQPVAAPQRPAAPPAGYQPNLQPAAAPAAAQPAPAVSPLREQVAQGAPPDQLPF